jgi:metal-responsive CopG/Arc/MetJ family transcriptional regulator
MPPSDKPFLNFVIDQQLLKRVDDFRYKHRFPTRAAAIKWLLDYALSQKPTPEPLRKL